MARIVIRLHVLPAPWRINPSPFCLKVETYCTLAGVAFETVPGMPIGAPRAKLPFMEHDGRIIPDSGLIVAYLKLHFGDPLDADLTAEQHAMGHLIRRTCEESLYFCLVYSRWIDAAGWAAIRPIFFNGLPPLVRDAIATIARRGVRRTLRAQGYGRHTRQDIYALANADMVAMATCLAQRHYAVGAEPTSYDASLYGMLANILSVPVETPLQLAALRLAPLVAYVNRMRHAIDERARHPP